MKALVFLLVACFSAAMAQQILETNETLILAPPADKNGETVILIGFPGALVSPSDYISLFQTVQNNSNFTMWVGFPKFPGNVPQDIEAAIPRTIKAIRDKGVNSTNLFMAGHSLGAFLSQDYLVENSNDFKGLIVLGKFVRFTYQDPQINFPVPVLTITGELDGHSKISRLAMSFNQMLRHPKGLGHLYFPVTLIPGAYHSSYMTGYVPPVINNTDIKPEISNEEAWQECSKLINAFLDAHLHIDSLETNDGAKFLHDYVYGTTYNLMRPLLDAFALEGNPYLYNESIITKTQWVIDNIFDVMNLSAKEVMTNIDALEIYNLSQFDNSDPVALFSHRVLEYKTYTHKEIEVVESEAIFNPPNQSALWISTKFKSAKFIYNVVGLESEANQISCKMLNQKAIDFALKTVPAKTLERYNKYGFKLVAGDDIECSNYSDWSSASAVYKDEGETLVFSSPKYLTETGDSFNSGSFYCKLLSPAKVAEWFYVDGLKKFHNAGIGQSDGNSTGTNAPPDFSFLNNPNMGH